MPTATSRAGFSAMEQAFEAARRNYPAEFVESFYTLAGCNVQFRIVGRDLAALYARAFAPRARPHEHAPTSATPPVPRLTVDLWDEAVTGQSYPPLAEAQSALPPTGAWHTQYGDESGRWVWVREAHAVTWLDRKGQRMVGWRAQCAQVRTHERSKPLSFLLPLWFYDQDIHVLHAGVVARAGAGVLITGGSGIGKTTTTLCCLLAGLDYLSDDQVAVVRAPATPDSFVAHSIFHSARVLPDHLARFPMLQTHAIPGQPPLDPKVLLYLAELFPNRVVAQAAIRAIALPRVAGQAQTCVRRASRVEAINYMAHTSLLTPFGIGRARFIHLTALLGSAPCYWLELGHDLTQIPAAIDQLIN